MEFLKKYRWQFFWVILYFVMGKGIYELSILYLPDGLNNIVNIVSILSAYTSVFALVIMLVQVISFKEIAKETKDRFNSILFISEYSKLIELTRCIQDDIKNCKYDLALYRLQLLRETILNNKFRIKSKDEDFSSYLGILGAHISALHTCILERSSEQINKIVIMTDLENLIVFMVEKSGETINQK